MTKWDNPNYIGTWIIIFETNLCYATLHQDFLLYNMTAKAYKDFAEMVENNFQKTY